MTPADRYARETILDRRDWAEGLFSLRCTRPVGFRFTPGQFARIGVEVPVAGGSATTLWRPYSLVSSADDPSLEFFSVIAPQGEFSPRLAAMQAGDCLLIDRTAYGFFTLERFADGRDLWLIATGTGLAPFVSMLHDATTWARYERVIIVHGVRYADNFAYADQFAGLINAGRALRYVRCATRERAAGALHGRIPALLEQGELERAAATRLSIEHSRVMICGNPAMIRSLRPLLETRGFRIGRRGNPGQMALEAYW
ncbi:MAG TPA: ferredoxin--NADP reductase [Rhodocyclaceae bacterium]|nr:ferredoxin--NADP reductase [Rhodocyclaceae bacterium]